MRIRLNSLTPGQRWLFFGLIAALVVLHILWSRLRDTWSPAQDSGPALADLVDDLAAGRPESLGQARGAAGRGGEAAAPALAAMLHHPEPRVRAAACVIVSDRLDEKWLAALLPRTSDADWRVRAAAFQALDAIAPLRPAPLRDAPLDEREAALLGWLDAHDARSSVPLGPDMCELYAGEPRLEFGRPVAARCLACHAGAGPAPFSASGACAACHAAIYAEWVESAHAQSLSHLLFATVNPATRQPERMEFGEVRGIGCRECHRPAGEPPPPVPQDRAGLERCPFRFRSDLPAAESCGRCHASTAAEHQAWLAGPQPRIATWPPGELDLEHRGDARTCIDCHMPPRPAGGDRDEPAHGWPARRDADRLRGAVAARLRVERRPAGGAAAYLVLTNLSGHACPTGTRRRALRISVGPAGERGSLVTDLSPDRIARPVGHATAALAPGERRVIHLFQKTPGHAAMTVRLLYLRDVGDPAMAVTDLLTLDADLREWAGPKMP
ncbi:MAG: hypothetical protein FJ288_07200 [Planctomycetes bacterium]|nr:hypothetical protein [Planctomycetota bacterium]